MATPTDNTTLERDIEKRCVIEATVVTGFESIARSEAIQKIHGSKVHCERGRIFITLPISSVRRILGLSSVDNCFVVMTRFPGVVFSQNELEAMRTIRNLVMSVDWEVGLRAWQEIFTFDHPILYQPEVIPEDLGEPQIVSRRPAAKKLKVDPESAADKHVSASKMNEPNEGSAAACDKKTISDDENASMKAEGTATCSLGSSDGSSEKEAQISVEKNSNSASSEQTERKRLTTHDPSKLTFRVTCNRTGQNHCFQSMCAAANFGGAIHQYFHWNIDMKKFDVEVILNIDGSDVNVCLGLTKESLHRRHITHFGPTTLKPTIAYNMLRMCKIQSGDVICDPMCGGGTIPIEGAVNWPTALHLCGEIHTLGASRTVDNVQDLNKKRLSKGKPPVVVDGIQWDACAMPLKDSSVDVFITDLPFGKRIGHKVNNWKLYPASLLEMARVSRPETGRACFLTHDKRCMIKTIHGLKKFWRQVRSVGINIGGLSAVVFLLYRTGKTVTPEDIVPTADVLRKLPEFQPIEEASPMNFKEEDSIN